MSTLATSEADVEPTPLLYWVLTRIGLALSVLAVSLLTCIKYVEVGTRLAIKFPDNGSIWKIVTRFLAVPL